MNFEKPRVEPWEMMGDAKRALGQTTFQKLLGIGTTQANRYCRNPKFTSDAENSILVRLRDLFDELSTAGASDQVRQMLNYLGASIGECVCSCSLKEPDKQTIAEECVDDLPPLALLHELMQSGEHPSVVRKAFDTVVSEISQDVSLYENQWKGKNQ